MMPIVMSVITLAQTNSMCLNLPSVKTDDAKSEEVLPLCKNLYHYALLINILVVVKKGCPF